jgi:hypothetical protein
MLDISQLPEMPPPNPSEPRVTLYQTADDIVLSFGATDGTWRADLGGTREKPTIEFKARGDNLTSGFSLDIATGTMRAVLDSTHHSPYTILAMMGRSLHNLLNRLASIGYIDPPPPSYVLRLQFATGDNNVAVRLVSPDAEWNEPLTFALNDE